MVLDGPRLRWNQANLVLHTVTTMKITEITRRDIADAITLENINWSGRMQEPDLLSRLYDLARLPSRDHRFKDAAGDIWQHRVNNCDWDNDWVFHDTRFGLIHGDDDRFLAFLCETIHP